MLFRSYEYVIQLKVKTLSGTTIYTGNSIKYNVRQGFAQQLNGDELLQSFFPNQSTDLQYKYSNGCFNEGSYIFTFQAFDAKTYSGVGSGGAIAISRECSFNVLLEQGASPTLISPMNKDSLDCNIQMVNFTWQLPFVTGEANKYLFEMAPVTKGFPANAILADDMKPNGYFSAVTTMPMYQLFVSAGTLEIGRASCRESV